MTNDVSYTKYESELVHHYRSQLGQAESTEDVKKIFQRVVKQLLREIEPGTAFQAEDITLVLEQAPFYTLAAAFNAMDVIKDSDLAAILQRFAEPAAHRYKHLDKHPEKTESKIRSVKI